MKTNQKGVHDEWILFEVPSAPGDAGAGGSNVEKRGIGDSRQVR